MAYDAEITQKSRDLIALERARAIVWSKRRSPCIYVALGHAKYPDQFASELAGLLGFSDVGAVFHWNDALWRTKAEVLARFDSAIARLSIPGERDE